MPPTHKQPDAWEHEYAIRRLNEAVELLTIQAKENARDIQKGADTILQFKTAVAIWSVVISTAVTVALKFLFK